METERDYPEHCPDQDELEKQALEAFAERIQRDINRQNIKNSLELKKYMEERYKNAGGTLRGTNG